MRQRLRGVSLLSMIVLAAACLSNVKGTGLAVAADVAPSKTKVPEIEVHATYGTGGSTRPPEIIAGEVLNLLFSLSNIAVMPESIIDCILQSAILDSTGRVVLPLPAFPINGEILMRDGRVFKYLDLPIPSDLQPGAYTIRTRVYSAKDVQLAEHSFLLEVKPTGTFGAANICLTQDQDGNQPATGVFAEGSEVSVHFIPVGLGKSNGRVLTRAEADVMDVTGNSVLVHPLVLLFDNNIADDAIRGEAQGMPTAHLRIGLTKSGNFSIRVKLFDEIAEKTASYDIPIIVVPRP